MQKNWKTCLTLFGITACFVILAACMVPLAFINDGVERDVEELSDLQGEFPIPLAEVKFESKGNDTTGQAAAWFAGIGALPVAMDLVTRRVILQAPWNAINKARIGQFIKASRKFLMPFHTYLSILALTLGITHLFLSSCAGNPFPEMGLILMGILMITGLVFKFKLGPAVFRKWVYKFHASLIVSGILVTILLVGHTLMD
jgi:hypothetical protein